MQRVSIIHVLAIALILSLSLLAFIPLFASTNDIPSPNSDPSVLKVFAYQNCLVTNDEQFVVELNTPYTTIPTTPSSSAYLVRMLNDLGVEIASTPLVAYGSLNGYTYNTAGLYFNNDKKLVIYNGR